MADRTGGNFASCKIRKARLRKKRLNGLAEFYPDAMGRNTNHFSADLYKALMAGQGQRDGKGLAGDEMGARFYKHPSGADILNKILIGFPAGGIIDGHGKRGSGADPFLLIAQFPLFKQRHKKKSLVGMIRPGQAFIDGNLVQGRQTLRALYDMTSGYVKPESAAIFFAVRI